MIHKIVHIKNLGRYKNFISSNESWDGVLGRINAIYADNGSGKTTFTQLIKSLKGDFQRIVKRKSFGVNEKIDILLIDDNNKQIRFKENKWNKTINDIEVFDTYYIDSNVYLITLGNLDTRGTFFEIVVGNEGAIIADKIIQLRNLRKKKGQQRRNYKYTIRKTEDEKKIKDLNKKIEKSLLESYEITKDLKNLDIELVKVAEKFGRTYLDKINEYLKLFNPNIQLTKLNKKGSRFVYYIKILEFDIRSDSESISLKHTLSEGDKSSLALAFFLARLKIQENLDKKTIIFDDPISSFDSSRRSVTINQLVSLSKRCKQFILLSHDINFVKDFISRSENCKSLKIVFKNSTSILMPHNIELETMTGIYKDLTVMHNFLLTGETSEFDKREVVRCLRPSVEGMFRLKYFTIFKSDDWLGEMLKSIRESNENSPLFRLKLILDDLSDINDYSKSYHHSNPNYLEIPLNSEELKNYVNRTIELIQKI